MAIATQPFLLNTQSLFVVFVDDQTGLLEGIERVLASIGCDWEVECVRDPATAMAIAAARPVDVFVAGMRLAGTMGTKLLSEVQKQRPETVRVLLADEADEDAALRALNVAHRVLWRSLRAEELVGAVTRVIRLHELLASERVRRLVGRVDTLPPAPQLYVQLTKTLEDENCDVGQLAGIVSQDPALAAKVLQLCNSAFFSAGRVITDIRSAVIRLGLENLKRATLASELFSRSNLDPAYANALQKRALLASTLAPKFLEDRISKELAATAALLADVGFLLPGFQHEESKLSPGETFDGDPEQPSHAEAGAYLLGLWGLPLPVVEAVAFHHGPQRAGGSSFGVIGAVHLAVALACGSPVDENFLRHTGMFDYLGDWRAMAYGLSEAA